MYIRFGNIPEGEKSKIWRIDECVGEQAGVSVYDAFVGEDGKVSVGFPLPATASTLDTFISLIRYQQRPAYLVEGDFVGRGVDDEPLIRNIRIIQEIKL